MNHKYIPFYLAPLAIAFAGFQPSAAQAQEAKTAELPRTVVPFEWTSGALSGLNAQSTGVASEDILFVDGAPWVQVQFDGVSLGQGSYIQLTSLKDGATQKLDAEMLAQSNNASAYFNGDSVRIEVFVAPNDLTSSVGVKALVAGEAPTVVKNSSDLVTDIGTVGTESICGTDDRIFSSEPRVARIDPIGCTAWTIGNGLMLTAGHCLAGGSRNEIISFNPPLSSSNGTVQFPGPEDQYVIDQSSFDFVNGGIGNDWGVFTVFNNSVTGLQPMDAQGFFDLRQSLTPPNIRITGFGVDSGSANQTNQTHVGPNVGSSGTTMSYTADTEGGNSGSPVIDEATGDAVGIHTHGGCSTGGNKGTSLFNSGLVNAINAVSAPPPSSPAECANGSIDLSSTSAYSSTNSGSFSVSSDGCSISLSGNIWRQTTQTFQITSSSVLTFTFSTNGTGEIQGIGLDEDSTASDNRIFQLTGSQAYGIDDFTYTENGGEQRMSIPIGQYYTGTMALVIANDKDSGTADNVVTVSDVVITN